MEKLESIQHGDEQNQLWGPQPAQQTHPSFCPSPSERPFTFPHSAFSPWDPITLLTYYKTCLPIIRFIISLFSSTRMGFLPLISWWISHVQKNAWKHSSLQERHSEGWCDSLKRSIPSLSLPFTAHRPPVSLTHKRRQQKIF